MERARCCDIWCSQSYIRKNYTLIRSEILLLPAGLDVVRAILWRLSISSTVSVFATFSAHGFTSIASVMSIPCSSAGHGSGHVLLLVDGLDETIAEHSGREALDRIVTFLQASNASVICTSRPHSYRALGIPPSWAIATLTPLSDQKIEELATWWVRFPGACY